MHMHECAHALYLSACFTTLLRPAAAVAAGVLWPSAVLQRQPVMCQEGGNEEGGKEREEEVECQLTMK